MGLAAYFAWYHVKAHRIAILLLYAFNLILNALWSYAFFALHDLGLSVFLIALLDIVVLSLTFRFLKWWPPSGNLMMPYLAWILFATYLNVNLFLLN
jgi:tryptophan-rich sensory protein